MAKEFVTDSETLHNGRRNIVLIQCNHTESTSEFLIQVRMYKYKDSVSLNPFENIVNFAIRLSLPYSNAEVERVLRAMNIIKSKF